MFLFVTEVVPPPLCVELRVVLPLFAGHLVVLLVPLVVVLPFVVLPEVVVHHPRVPATMTMVMEVHL